MEPGELLTEALIREVREETGLEVTAPGPLLYAVHAARDDSAEDHPTLVFVFAVAGWRGDLHVADPDNLIRTARFLPRAEAIEKLDRLPWRMMREPIVAHLRGQAERGAVWLYRRAADGADMLVSQTTGAAG